MRRHHTQDPREIELLTWVQGARRAIAMFKADPARRDAAVVLRLQEELEAAEQTLTSLRVVTSRAASDAGLQSD